jgi:hypothetical protein
MRGRVLLMSRLCCLRCAVEETDEEEWFEGGRKGRGVIVMKMDTAAGGQDFWHHFMKNHGVC